MAPTLSPTIPPKDVSDSFPVGGIIGIAVGGYMVLFGIAIIIRQCLIYKGIKLCSCGDDENSQCCPGCSSCSNDDTGSCFESCAETFDCTVPNKQQCMDICCPTKEWCNETFCCCLSTEPSGPCCENCDGPACECGNCCDINCQCTPPKSINCLCFIIDCDTSNR